VARIISETAEEMVLPAIIAETKEPAVALFEDCLKQLRYQIPVKSEADAAKITLELRQWLCRGMIRCLERIGAQGSPAIAIPILQAYEPPLKEVDPGK